MSFVDTNVLLYAICPGEKDWSKAKKARYQTAYWNAAILAAAANSGCAELYSEDLNADQTYDGVRVVNPFA